MGDGEAVRTRERDSWSRFFDALDGIVRENRFAIAVVFPAVGAVTLVASAEGLLPPPLAFNPLFVLFGTLVMRLPLLAALAPLVDRWAGAALTVLVLYAYLIEFVGVHTGWPYGEFAYGVDLGPMLAGAVPLGLPVFFVPLVANAYLLCLLALGRWAESAVPRLLSALALVLAIDLVLDPGAVALDFWDYGGGPYYGVPWSNYRGWLLSGTVAVVCLDLGFDRAALARRLADCEFALDDMVSFVLLWGAVNAVYGNWVPVAVAALFGAALAATDRFTVPTRPRWL